MQYGTSSSTHKSLTENMILNFVHVKTRSVRLDICLFIYLFILEGGGSSRVDIYLIYGFYFIPSSVALPSRTLLCSNLVLPCVSSHLCASTCPLNIGG